MTTSNGTGAGPGMNRRALDAGRKSRGFGRGLRALLRPAVAAIVLLATLSAYAVPTPLPLRSESAATDIYDATTTHTIETSYGNTTYPWVALPFTGTTTYDFYSPPLTAAVTLNATDTAFGSVNVTNESGPSFVVTGEYQFYDYNPATGSQTLIAGTGAGTNATVNTAALQNLYTPTVTLPAGYTVPVGDLLHIAVTVTLVSGTPSTASFVYNGISGGHVGTGAQLPQNRLVTWSFGALVGPLASFTFGTIGGQTAGTAFNVSVTAYDSNNERKTSFNGTVDLTTTAATITPAVSGSFSGGGLTQSVTLTGAGPGQTITATDAGGSGSTGTSGAFTLYPSGAKLVFTVEPPSTTVAGANMASFVVQLEDAGGNPLAYSGTSVTLTPSSGTISSGTNPRMTDSTGRAIFDDIAIGTAASGLTFSAAASPVASATSTSFNIIAAPVNQTPLPLRYESAQTDIYDATTAQTIEYDGYGSSPTPLAFTGTTTYDFYSPPLTAAQTISSGTAANGTLWLTNGSGGNLQVTGAIAFYDYDPTTGLQTPVVTASGGAATTVNSHRAQGVAVQAGSTSGAYTFPTGHLLHIAVTISLTSGSPGTASYFIINGPSGGYGGSQALFPDSATQAWSFNSLVGALDHFAFGTITSPQTAGTPFSVTVTAQDAIDQTKTSFTGKVNLGGTAGVTGSSGSFTGGTWAGNVTATTAGTAQDVTAVNSAGAQTGTSGAFTVNAGAVTKLAVTSSAVTVTAGVASGSITVQRQDQYGNPNTAEATRAITLSSSSTGTVTFTPSSLSIATGSSSASFTYTDTKAGTPTVTAASTSPTTITSATQVETVNPAAASKLVFTTTAVTVTAGVASGTIMVQRQDQYNNPNTADAARTVTLSSTSSGTVTFTPASPLTIAPGSSSASFTYTDTKAGTPTVTAASTAPTTITSATQVETVNPAAASKLVFTTTAVTVTAGVASGTITVQRQDQYNNPNTADAARTVTLSSSSSGTVTFTPASPLTIAPGSSGTSFTYTDTKVGTPTVTAASTSPTTITSATQVETVNPAAASKLVFTTTAVTVTAGVASGTITVQRQDPYGNPSTADAARTVTLSSTSSGTVTFTPASPLTIALGSSSTSFTYTDTKAGTPTVTAASTSPTTITSATQVETVNPAAASKLVFTTTAVTVTAGVASGTITVQRQDPYGNPNTAEAARTVTLSSPSSGTVTFTPASPLTIAFGSSSASFTYTDTKAGTPTVTAASTSPTTITSATQVETVNPGTANKLAFTTQPPANTTAGANMAGFVVQVEDSYGNAVADNGVVVTLTPSSGSIYSGATATTAASGAATFGSTVIWTAETGIDFAASAAAPSLSGTSGAFNITPECSAGETTKGYSINYVSGAAYIGFTNQYGLGSVVGLRLTNCTMTAQPYGAGGVPLGSPLSLPDNNIGGSYVALPAGTTNVLCTATKNNGSLPANANAMVKNLCGTFALKLDPVSARLEIAGGGRTQLIFTNVPAAERFISVQNGTSGLTKLTVLVNGQSFVLSPLSAGSSRSLDVGAAMNPGNANIVVLLGEGAEGASATIAIADSPTGDATMAAESIALQIETSAQGLQLSWPIAGAGYLLQSRSSLAPGDAWANWPGAAESVNGRWVMPLPRGDPARFFRLYCQP